MWDIKEKRITNKETSRRTAGNSPTMESMMEMRRCRWLSKLSAMEKSRSSRKILGAWCPTPRKAGRPKQTIRHAYVATLERLGFEAEICWNALYGENEAVRRALTLQNRFRYDPQARVGSFWETQSGRVR
jgi:hypothetical protein